MNICRVLRIMPGTYQRLILAINTLLTELPSFDFSKYNSVRIFYNSKVFLKVYLKRMVCRVP